MKSINEILVYEKDGSETEHGAHTINVITHWNRKRTMVVLEVEGVSVTVPADDLRKAIDNATNCAD